jgi:hypothetical protein
MGAIGVIEQQSPDAPGDSPRLLSHLGKSVESVCGD